MPRHAARGNRCATPRCASCRAALSGRRSPRWYQSQCQPLWLALWLALATPAFAADPVAAFVDRAFAQEPAAQTLWLTADLKKQAREAAGFSPDGARARYWRDGNRTAWVLDRIGKQAPITFGVIVDNDAIVAIDVITYRESHGGEIRSPRFLAQFTGSRAVAGGIDRSIDNISGATLSVRAARDVARLALFLHRQSLGRMP